MNKSASLPQRLKSEFTAYLTISAYLFICFSVLLLYKNSLLQEESSQLLPFSLAVVKALIFGKFVLIGKAVKVGERKRPQLLLHRILWKSAAMLLALLVFVALEELIVGHLHGHSMAQIVDEFLARSWIEKLAPSLVMLLILVPMTAYEEIDNALGKGRLWRMLSGSGSTS